MDSYTLGGLQPGQTAPVALALSLDIVVEVRTRTVSTADYCQCAVSVFYIIIIIIIIINAMIIIIIIIINILIFIIKQCAVYELIEKIPKILLKNAPATVLGTDPSLKPVSDDCHISSEIDLSVVGRTVSTGGSNEVEEVEKESAVDCAKLSLQLPVESGSRVKPKSDVSTAVVRSPCTIFYFYF